MGSEGHDELIAWQRAHELKLGVYALIESGPVVDDEEFCEQILPLQRLAKRSSKAATSLIAYLGTAKPPNDRHPSENPRNPKNPRTRRTRPSEPPEPAEPHEP